MNTANPYADTALGLSISHPRAEESEPAQYFGNEQDYKKTKKYLVWFSLSALVVFASTAIFVF